MKIITGKTATEHVNSEDDRGLYAGILGGGSYVLDIGTKFRATIQSSNTVRIESGDLVHQGCHARIPYDEYDEVTIDSCTAGCKRIDLIVARYRKQTGLESVTIEVIKGGESISDPVQPGYETGNILEGDEISDMPLYAVNLSNPGSSTTMTITKAYKMLPSQLSMIASYIYPVGAIYLSTNSTSPAILFGGTWERIEDRFLLAAGDTYAAGATGGEAEHTLIVNEMPPHSHEAFLSTGSVQGVSLPSGGHDEVSVGMTIRDTHETGGGQAHNNMPPYLTVYMWKRTA